jgi:hypothetical protein
MKKRIVFYIIFLIVILVGWVLLLQLRFRFPDRLTINLFEWIFLLSIITFQILFSLLFIKDGCIKKIIYPVLFLVFTQLIFLLVSYIFYGISYIIGWTSHFNLFNKDIMDPLNIFIFLLILIYCCSTVIIWELYWKKRDKLEKVISRFFKQHL